MYPITTYTVILTGPEGPIFIENAKHDSQDAGLARFKEVLEAYPRVGHDVKLVRSVIDETLTTISRAEAEPEPIVEDGDMKADRVADPDVRAKLAELFKQFRKEGYLARMNHLCCSSCAGSDLSTRAEELNEKGKSVKGCVFWHNQDESGWNSSGYLPLRYGPLDTSKSGEIGLSAKEIGEYICQSLTAAGITHNWDGDPGQVIFVLGPKDERPSYRRAQHRRWR